MINRRKGNKIAKKEDKRIRGSIYEVRYPNMCAPEMKTGKKKKNGRKTFKNKKDEKEKEEEENFQNWST